MMLFILVSTALRTLIVGVGTWLVLRVVRAGNPHVEVLIWRMLLLAGIALPVLLYWGLAPNVDALELPGIVVGVRPAPIPGVSAHSVWQTVNWLLLIYLCVGLVHVGRLAAGLVGTWLVCRAARPMAGGDDVRISARIRSPATFGKIILLPTDAMEWPAERLETVLAHERAHVRSRDGYWSWLAQLHAAVFWISPFAWWLWRRLDLLAETTSDDAVIAERHDPMAYATLLLDFARRPNMRRVAMSVAESNISKRIERLLAHTPPGSALTRKVRWSTLALLVPVAVLAATTTRATPPVQGTAVTGPATQTPRTDFRGVKLVRPVNPDNYYPAVAAYEKVSGSVVLEADVDVLGQLVDVRVLQVQPAEPRYGFADAALQVARDIGYANTSGQPGSIKFMVKFQSKM